MEHLDIIIKLLTLVTTVVLGMNWVVKRIESGQKNILKVQKKVLKQLAKKVSRKECEQNQEKCPCRVVYNQMEKK